MSVIKGDKLFASENMLRDISLFNSSAEPSVRIYGWSRPSITVGYFQDIEKEIDTIKASDLGIDVVKRPTGGGIVFHTTEDVTYCVAAPLSSIPGGLMDSYYFISDIILNALKNLGIKAELSKRVTNGRSSLDFARDKPATNRSICFSSPREYEITLNGRKLVGSAQKRTKEKLMQQGTISVKKTPELFFSLLKKPIGMDAYYSSTIAVEEMDLRLAVFSDITSSALQHFSASVLPCFRTSALF